MIEQNRFIFAGVQFKTKPLKPLRGDSNNTRRLLYELRYVQLVETEKRTWHINVDCSYIIYIYYKQSMKCMSAPNNKLMSSMVSMFVETISLMLIVDECSSVVASPARWGNCIK